MVCSFYGRIHTLYVLVYDFVSHPTPHSSLQLCSLPPKLILPVPLKMAISVAFTLGCAKGTTICRTCFSTLPYDGLTQPSESRGPYRSQVKGLV